MPDAGEQTCVEVPPTPPPDQEFAAELVSVKFDSGVKVSHSKATVAGPHWEVGKEKEIADDWAATAKKLGLPAEPYSKRPAVYLIKGAPDAEHYLTVEVKVTKSVNVSGEAKLQGNFNGLVFEGWCETSAGTHKVDVKIVEPPDAIKSYRGEIAWGLELEDAPICQGLGSTLAELYFILDKPAPRPYSDGVWVEALRFLCGKVGVVGESKTEGVAEKITRYCHSRHKLRYDTFRGGSKYGLALAGGEFKLMGYMKRTSPICNCYDQAAAVQALSLALGAPVEWVYMDPYGFIKATDLVGVGRCNNPFYKLDVTKKVVPFDSPDRTAFGNHAFAGLPSEKVLDACAGPHTGDETREKYVDESIDKTPSLYPGSFQPGTADAIASGSGVSGVK
jgi:hypothetical protein